MDKLKLNSQLSKIGTPECRIYARDKFEKHAPISWILKAYYVRTSKYEGYVTANQKLGTIDKRLTWLDGNTIIFTNDKVKHLANLYSGAAKGIFDRKLKETSDYLTATEAVRTYVRRNGLTEHFPENLNSRTYEQLMKLVVRTFDEAFWRKHLKRISGRTVEALLRELGATKKNTGVYVSNFSLSKTKQNRKRNKTFLETHKAISESGVEITLEQAHEASISNPKNRVAELMVRMRGQENYARDGGYAALFLTMTCPSAYHAFMGNSGKANKNFKGFTPKNGMDYLNSTWQRIRDEIKKNSIYTFGMRVCEPHHDGTPHFHLLIYLKKEHVQKYKEIFKKHCFKVDSDEKGADKHRCDIKDLDLENGSPTGYLAKYISKNIDGEGVGEDLEASLDASVTSERVCAWASLWGIRQFSEINTIPITVYRECRRLKSVLTGKKAAKAEQVRSAADKGDYAAYMKAMGGPNTKRADLILRAFHIAKEKKNKFNEVITRLLGLADRESDEVIQTRPEEWSIQPLWMVQATEAAQPPPLEYWQ